MGTTAKVNVKKLVSVCREFINENDIHCVEAIYQTDHVIEHAYEFIQQICEIVGYSDINEEKEI